MTTIKKTPLEHWIKLRIGGEPGADLTPSLLAQYQLDRLNETLDLARRQSPFYKELLANLPQEPLSSLEDIRRLPFTTPDDLAQHHLRMLCVSQSDIARVLTLPGSSDSDPPKRLYFTEEDLESTADFFHHGMSTLVESGQKVLILMPGPAPGSIGNLLVRGLSRMGVKGIIHGPVFDTGQAVDDVLNYEIDSLVGIPVQALAMARLSKGRIPLGRIKSVLLSADYVPDAIVRELESSWGCRAFEHYGMTEMVYGGAVQCDAHDGYHMREADLYFEIVSPDTGSPAPDGQVGEVVFTTLTRHGMPLIRYRTGDLGRFISEPCPCGSMLRRLDKITGRFAGQVRLAGSHILDIAALDEAVFQSSRVVDYIPEMTNSDGRALLTVKVTFASGDCDTVFTEVRRALERAPVIQSLLSQGLLTVDIIRAETAPEPSTGRKKRKIMDYRREFY